MYLQEIWKEKNSVWRFGKRLKLEYDFKSYQRVAGEITREGEKD